MLKLAERGKLDLNQDVGRYMDAEIRIDGRGRAWAPASWSKSTEFWERDMTIAQLLANLSGADTKWSGVREENWQMKDLTKERRALAEERAAAQHKLAEAKTDVHREAAARKHLQEVAKKRASGKKKKVRRKRQNAKKYRDDPENEHCEGGENDIEAKSHEVGTGLVDDGLPPVGERLINFFPDCVYPPGEVHTDPAFGFSLLGHIVEEVSGLSLWQFAAYHIFNPLKMQGTTLAGPGFLNPGPDPENEAREEAVIQRRQTEKFTKRKEQMEIDKARAKAIRKADEAKRWNDKMAVMRGEEDKSKSVFGEMVENKNRFEEIAKTEARDRQWETDLAWEKQMDAERARQRAHDRDRAAVAVREGRQLEVPAGWKGDWPPKLWHGFRAWPGYRLTAWAQGVPKPKDAHARQLTLTSSPRAPIPALAPALSLLTTGRDMGRLLICLCNGGSYKGQRILEETTVKASQAQFSSPHPALGGATLSGFAEYRDMVNNALVIDSGDPATGASSSMIMLPEHKVAMFVSFNCCSGHGMHRIQPSITQRFLDHFYPIPHAPDPKADVPDIPPPPTDPLLGNAGHGQMPMLEGGPELAEESEDSAEDDGTEEQFYRREFRRKRREKREYAQLGQEVQKLFKEHTLDLFSAFAPLDPDGDFRISRVALGKGLRRLIPTIQQSHIEYLAAAFPAPDKSADDDDEDGVNEEDVTLRSTKMAGDDGDMDAHGTGDAEDEDEGIGAVDYRALSNAFGQSWIASMAPKLQSAEHLAQYASYRAKRKFVPRPYVGHYISTKMPSNTIDMLSFYNYIIVVEPSDSAHLKLSRFQEQGPAFRELHSCTSEMEVVVVQPQRHVFMRTDRKELVGFGTTFEGGVSHLFLQPAPFATFRRLNWYEYHQVQAACYVFFITFFLGTIAVWSFLATPTLVPWPTWLGGQDATGGLCFGAKCRDYYHNNTFEELASWLMLSACTINALWLGVSPFFLRRYVNTGAMEEWHRSGPPRRLRLYLCVPVGTLLLTKGLMVMVVWLFIKGQKRDPSRPYDRTEMPWEMWSVPERVMAVLVTVVSLLFYKWLDSWQLIGYRW